MSSPEEIIDREAWLRARIEGIVQDIGQIHRDQLQTLDTKHQEKINTLERNLAQVQDRLAGVNETKVKQLNQTNQEMNAHITALNMRMNLVAEEHAEEVARLNQVIGSLDRTQQNGQAAIEVIDEDQKHKVAALEAANQEQKSVIQTLESNNMKQMKKIEVLELNNNYPGNLFNDIHSRIFKMQQEIEDLKHEKNKYKERSVRSESAHAAQEKRIETLQSDRSYYKNEVKRLQDVLYKGHHDSSGSDQLAWISNQRDTVDLLVKFDQLAKHREHWMNQSLTASDGKDRMAARKRCWILDIQMDLAKKSLESFMSTMRMVAQKTDPFTKYEAEVSTEPVAVVAGPEGTPDDASRPDDGATIVVSSTQDTAGTDAIVNHLSEDGAETAAATPSGAAEGNDSSGSELVDDESTGNEDPEQTAHEPSSLKRNASPTNGNSPKRVKCTTAPGEKHPSSDKTQAMKDLNICPFYYAGICTWDHCMYRHMDRRSVDDLLDL